MVRIRAEVLLVRRMGERQLQTVAVLEAVRDVHLQHVERMVEAQMRRQHRYEHRMLHDVAHDARAEEVARTDRHGDVALHATLRAHLLQSVLLLLQPPFVLVRRLRHVGDQMAELHVLAPRLLVVRIAGVAQLRRPDAEVHDHRVHDGRIDWVAAFGQIGDVAVELIDAHRARFLDRIGDDHVLDVVHVVLPLVLADVHHVLQRAGRHQRPGVVQQIAQHLGHGEHLLAVVGQVAHEARQEVEARTGVVAVQAGLQIQIEHLEDLDEKVVVCRRHTAHLLVKHAQPMMRTCTHRTSPVRES